MAARKKADETTEPKADRDQLYAALETQINSITTQLVALGTTRDAAGKDITPATDPAELVKKAASTWRNEFNKDMRLYTGATLRKTLANDVVKRCVKARSELGAAIRKFEEAQAAMVAAREAINDQAQFFAAGNEARRQAEIAENEAAMQELADRVQKLKTGTVQPKRRAPTRRKTATTQAS